MLPNGLTDQPDMNEFSLPLPDKFDEFRERARSDINDSVRDLVQNYLPPVAQNCVGSYLDDPSSVKPVHEVIHADSLENAKKYV